MCGGDRVRRCNRMTMVTEADCQMLLQSSGSYCRRALELPAWVTLPGLRLVSFWLPLSLPASATPFQINHVQIHPHAQRPQPEPARDPRARHLRPHDARGRRARSDAASRAPRPHADGLPVEPRRRAHRPDPRGARRRRLRHHQPGRADAHERRAARRPARLRGAVPRAARQQRARARGVPPAQLSERQGGGRHRRAGRVWLRGGGGVRGEEVGHGGGTGSVRLGGLGREESAALFMFTVDFKGVLGAAGAISSTDPGRWTSRNRLRGRGREGGYKFAIDSIESDFRSNIRMTECELHIPCQLP
nr:hypothetical protein CFP56_21654 [Quercus suber]